MYWEKSGPMILLLCTVDSFVCLHVCCEQSPFSVKCPTPNRVIFSKHKTCPCNKNLLAGAPSHFLLSVKHNMAVLKIPITQPPTCFKTGQSTPYRPECLWATKINRLFYYLTLCAVSKPLGDFRVGLRSSSLHVAMIEVLSHQSLTHAERMV